MSDKSAIEWTNRTWNCVTGCDSVSPGCDHCYARTMSKRLKAMGNPRYQNDGNSITSGPGFGLTLHWDLIGEPFKWKKPQMVFVNSMSDLFHDKVPFGFLHEVFSTMAATPRHTYQVLTKRGMRLARVADRLPWTPNIWMGVSVENEDVTHRIDRLISTDAQVKFLSCEPLLGRLDLDPYLRHLDWVIAGGESGPGARPCDPGWLTLIRDQCIRYRVPFFLKQLGGFPNKRGHEEALLDGRLWREFPVAA